MPKVTEAHMEARRSQILGAACMCFADKGFHHSTMQDICSTAGLSPGAVYGYFSSKGDIIRALAEEGLQTNEHLVGELRREPDSRRALLGFAEFVLSCLDQRITETAREGSLPRIKVQLWAEAIRSPDILQLFQANYRTAIDGLEGIVRDGQERGQMDGGLDPRAMAQTVVSLIEGFVLQKAVEPDADKAKYLEVLARLLDCSLRTGKSATEDGSDREDN